VSKEVLDRVDAQFELLENLVKKGDEFLLLREPSVSGWSIGQQIDHVAKAGRAIFSGIAAGKPQTGSTISLIGRIVLFTGFIPRGVGKAPELYIGSERPPAELMKEVEAARAVSRALNASPEKLGSNTPVIRHPKFGVLTAMEALEFAEIHAEHHFKIVRDIEKAKKR
jgi:hypothetical protein